MTKAITLPTTRDELASLASRYNTSKSATTRKAIEALFIANANVITIDGLTYRYDGIAHIALVPTKSQSKAQVVEQKATRMNALVALIREGKAIKAEQQELANIVAGLIA